MLFDTKIGGDGKLVGLPAGQKLEGFTPHGIVATIWDRRTHTRTGVVLF